MRVRARALQAHYTLLRASRYTRALGNVRERKKGGDREGERAREGDVENTLHSRNYWLYVYEKARLLVIRMCMCSVVFVTRFLRLFSLIASSSRVETRADFVVSRSSRTPILLFSRRHRTLEWKIVENRS